MHRQTHCQKRDPKSVWSSNREGEGAAKKKKGDGRAGKREKKKAK